MGDSGRRDDKVIVDCSMTMGAKWFSLCATVRHQGGRLNAGQYGTTIKNGDSWETRDDAHSKPSTGLPDDTNDMCRQAEVSVYQKVLAGGPQIGDRFQHGSNVTEPLNSEMLIFHFSFCLFEASEYLGLNM